jgi:sodium/potassium/calcium exchanger 6
MSTEAAKRTILRSQDHGSWEHYFNSMQQDFNFFLFELVLMVYVMIVLAYIAEEFLMPSLKKIAIRYNLSKDLTGFIVALGNLVPELTTTILSFLSHGIKMTEFAIATNIGASIFAITIVPAVGALFAPPLIKGLQNPDSQINPYSFYRDLGFFTGALIFYAYAFQDGICSFASCCVLISSVFVYLGIVAYMNKQEENSPYHKPARKQSTTLKA